MRAPLAALCCVAFAAPAAAWIEGAQERAWLGFSVAGAGDIDDDGYDDLLVGALLHDADHEDEGVVFVHRGSAAGPLAPSRIEADQDAARLGSFVSGAGDVNHDGFDDFVVGAEAYDLAVEGEGVAFVFHGGPGGIATAGVASAAGRLAIGEEFGGLGFGDARAGDVDGDGFDDVVVGARFYGAAGGAFVVHGSASGIGFRSAAAADARIVSDANDAEFGAAFAPAGDVNGDGFDDVVVGAPEEAIGGAVYVFHGGPAGILASSPVQAATRLAAEQPGARFGYAVAGGDVDGDGYGDVVVGAPLAGSASGGAVFVFRGGASGIADGEAATAAVAIDTPFAGAQLGSAVAVGDLDGDGRAEVLAGAPRRDSALPGAGSVALLRGAAPLDARKIMWRAGDRAFAAFGSSVAAAGNVDGGVRAEWIAGAPFRSDADAEQGGALVAAPEPSAFAALLAALAALAAPRLRLR